jgi:hypothetical protein
MAVQRHARKVAFRRAASGATLPALTCALLGGSLFGMQRLMPAGGNHLCNRRLVAVRADETQKVAA